MLSVYHRHYEGLMRRFVSLSTSLVLTCKLPSLDGVYSVIGGGRDPDHRSRYLRRRYSARPPGIVEWRSSPMTVAIDIRQERYETNSVDKQMGIHHLDLLIPFIATDRSKPSSAAPTHSLSPPQNQPPPSSAPTQHPAAQ
jgi:hypothetical protein